MSFQARRVNNFNLYASHAWYVPGVKGMFALLLWFLVGSLIGIFLEMLFMLFVPMNVVNMYGMLIVYPVSFIPAMMYAARKSRNNSLFETGYKLSSSNFGKYSWWFIGIITILATLGTMITSDLPNWWNYKLTTSIPWLERMYNSFTAIMNSMTGGPFWSSFLLVAIFAPIFEEWLCRGMVLRGLLTKMRPAWAIIISALFFALIHMNPWQALNAFIIGVVMGFVYYKTGCLWLTMLMHFVNNGLAVVLSQFSSLSDTDFWIQILSPGAYAAAYIIGVIVLVACLLVFNRIPLKQERGNIDEVVLKVD